MCQRHLSAEGSGPPGQQTFNGMAVVLRFSWFFSHADSADSAETETICVFCAICVPKHSIFLLPSQEHSAKERDKSFWLVRIWHTCSLPLPSKSQNGTHSAMEASFIVLVAPFCTPIKRIYYVGNGNCPCRTSVKRFGNYQSK